MVHLGNARRVVCAPVGDKKRRGQCELSAVFRLTQTLPQWHRCPIFLLLELGWHLGVCHLLPKMKWVQMKSTQRMARGAVFRRLRPAAILHRTKSVACGKF